MVMSVGLLTRGSEFDPQWGIFFFSSYKTPRETTGMDSYLLDVIVFWLLIRNNMDLRRLCVDENAFSLYPIFILSCHIYCVLSILLDKKWNGWMDKEFQSILVMSMKLPKSWELGNLKSL